MTILINAIKVIFLLGFLVFIHEGGHFLAARLFKVRVEAFSIGFGPKIFTKKGKETVYSIGCIPFGGYVQMLGEEERSEQEGAFNQAKVLHRIIIVAAGAIVNIVFAVVVFFFLSVFSGYNISTTVSEIIPEAKENLAQVEIGDKIIKINDKKVRLKSDIARALEGSEGDNVTIVVERDGEELVLDVKPTEYSEGLYVLGVQVALADATWQDKIYYGFWETINFVGSMFESLKMLFTGQIGVDQMTGPIGISEIVVKSTGVYNFIYLLCLISLSLGITNLLPIPALDGGRIVLLIVEGIRGEALKEEIELGIQTAGFLLLILLSLYVSYKDVLRIF